MEYGFLVKMRCFLQIDGQGGQCLERRYYHEWARPRVLRETKEYRDVNLPVFLYIEVNIKYPLS